MSLLSIVVAALWLWIAVRGFRRGLVRTAISMVSFLLIMILVSAVSPIINDIFVERTGIKAQIEVCCAKALERALPNGNEPDRSEQISMIEELPIPMLLKKELLENNNSTVYESLSVATFHDYVTAFRLLVYLISFFLALLALKVIVNILDLFANLPILGGVNRLGGFMLGIINGLLYLWIFFLIITVFSGTDLGGYLLREIAGDKILDYLYENNLLMQFLISGIA